MSIFGTLFVGLLTGWLAGLIVRDGGLGRLGNLLAGAAGATIGWLLYQSAGADPRFAIGSILTPVSGAVLTLLAVGLIKHQ